MNQVGFSSCEYDDAEIAITRNTDLKNVLKRCIQLTLFKLFSFKNPNKCAIFIVDRHALI